MTVRRECALNRRFCRQAPCRSETAKRKTTASTNAWRKTQSAPITPSRPCSTSKVRFFESASSGRDVSCSLAVRRVPPQFSIPPQPMNEVMLGASLNLTCVAVGSPMPFVKWRKGLTQDLTPEDKLPIGKNTLELTNIQESANYTCIAASALGVIESVAQVKVQCEYCSMGASTISIPCTNRSITGTTIQY